jgi:hypothetical protein
MCDCSLCYIASSSKIVQSAPGINWDILAEPHELATGTIMKDYSSELEQQTTNRSLYNTLGCVDLNHTCSFLQVLCRDDE